MHHSNAPLSANHLFKIVVLLTVFVIWRPAISDTDTDSAVKTVSDDVVVKPASDEFGRLFTSQYERNAIDRARLTGGFIPAKVSGVDENVKTPLGAESAQPVKVLGVLLRADGKNKVWLSGGTEAQQNILGKRAITGSIQQSANVKVGVNSQAILKPGQVWSAATGRQEAYQIPVPKPLIAEPVPAPKIEQQQSSTATSATQSSSVNSSGVNSSVSSSTK